MKNHLALFLLLLTINLFAEGEGGCSIPGLLERSKSPLVHATHESNCAEDLETELRPKIAINEKLMSVKILHEAKEVLIERTALNKEQTCPPFCIEAMNVKDVRTLGELEVLAFIDKLKEKKARLAIDVRKSSLYVQGSIPGAINLPFTMLKDESAYQEKVLKLLGAKFIKKKWSFKNAQTLLIFGSSVISSEASSTIKKLLDLGYPSKKLFYYRAGVLSWKGLGLTVR